MAKATTKPTETPDIILELTYEEAQTIRDIIGWKVGGTSSGRRALTSEVFRALESVVKGAGAHDMTGNINFV